MEEQRKNTNWLQIVSIVVITFLVVEVILLISYNKQLKEQLEVNVM